VYIRKRVRKRRSIYKKRRILFLALGGVLAFLFAFVFLKNVNVPTGPGRISHPSSFQIPDLNEKFQLAKYERVVYPYSVIPGGVRSREELAASMSRDSVIAAHYADFKVSQARMVKADQPLLMHVSYRMQDQVYWTSKKVEIPEGETLITDGDEIARARCGNRVSAVPVEPISEEEPIIEIFDFPRMASMDTPDLGPIAQLSLELREFSPFESIPIEPNILPYYYRPLFVVSESSPVIPEAGTLSLLAIGLTGLLVFRFVRKK
jgi:hypothetical protein